MVAPTRAISSMAYWVLRPISGASQSRVGLAIILSQRVLAPLTLSSSERAGKMPSTPFKPKTDSHKRKYSAGINIPSCY